MDHNLTPYETSTATRNELNLNDADDQQDFNLIPEGTIAKVRMTIKPGGYNEPARGCPLPPLHNNMLLS